MATVRLDFSTRVYYCDIFLKHISDFSKCIFHHLLRGLFFKLFDKISRWHYRESKCELELVKTSWFCCQEFCTSDYRTCECKKCVLMNIQRIQEVLICWLLHPHPSRYILSTVLCVVCQGFSLVNIVFGIYYFNLIQSTDVLQHYSTLCHTHVHVTGFHFRSLPLDSARFSRLWTGLNFEVCYFSLVISNFVICWFTRLG